MASRGFGVALASIVGSFFVHGAHVACGGGAHVLPSAPAQTAAAAPSGSAVPTSALPPPADSVSAKASDGRTCGCTPPRTTAWMTFAGDEKIALDPVDAEASLEVSYGRGPGGKRRIVLSGVVRAFRTDVPAEHPTTFSIRMTLPDPAAASVGGATADGGASAATDASFTLTPTVKDLEAYLSTWPSGGAVAPRVYATVTKSSVTATVSGALVEIRGALTLKDVPTGRTVTIDKLSLRKVGASLLPERVGTLRAP